MSLCDNPVEPGLAVGAPPDALTEGIDLVAAAYRGLSREHPQVCTHDLGPRFDLVFNYPNRAQVRLTGAHYGCREIGNRYGARTVLETFLEQLRLQRLRQQPWSQNVAAPSCPREDFRQTYLVPAPAELTRAALCVPSPDGDLTGIRTVGLSDSDLVLLRTDLVAHSEAVGPNTASGPECTGLGWYLVATNSYGEQLNIQIQCNWRAGWAPALRAEETMRWDVSPETRALIERLSG